MAREVWALWISIVGLFVAICSAGFSFYSSTTAHEALRDTRTFNFDIACGPAIGAGPDYTKLLLLNGIDFSTFLSNGDKRIQKRASTVACNIYNLSKDPVPRLTFRVFVSSVANPKVCWPQDVVMDGFLPESSKILWLANEQPRQTTHISIGNIVRYLDPVDKASRVVTIPQPLMTLNLASPKPLVAGSRAASSPTPSPRPIPSSGPNVPRISPYQQPGVLNTPVPAELCK